MWTITICAGVLLAIVLVVDHRLRTSPAQLERVCLGLLILSLVLLAVGGFYRPQTLVGVLMALTAANTFVVYQRAKSMAAVMQIERDKSGAAPTEAPYEQFVNTFLSYFDRGDADALEFEFRNWRAEMRFRKGDRILPVTDTPFHMLIQIKRLIDAATVRNAKTGESKTRYVAREMLYEFASEDVGGSLLRLKLLAKRQAATDEIRAFDRVLASVR